MSASNVPQDFAHRLIDWQLVHGRHGLPWQNTRDPYRVWLSEVMLQQTQVTTVLPYYERFLQRFPDVGALAGAPLDEVLALWSGLGYYSRARNLHRCAQQVVGEHSGVFPASAQALESLPGIGRSTAAAIAAFCFGERVAILDGNVKRVLSRVLGFDGDLAQAAQERVLWAKATELLPDRGMEPYTQGLMDLGATVCLSRKPQCDICPAQPLCRASKAGDPTRYPVRSRKIRRHQRESVWVWLQWRDWIWLVQRPSSGIWAGLWSFPELESVAEFQQLTSTWLGRSALLPSLTHTLTHLDWTLHPARWFFPDDLRDQQVGEATAVLGGGVGRWFDRREVLDAGLPAPLRKLISASA